MKYRGCCKRVPCIIFFLHTIGFSISYSQPVSSPSLQQRSDPSWIDTLKPWSEYVLAHPETMTPRDLVRQKQVRNRYQRRGYPEILCAALSEDGLSALFSYVKLRLHVEFSMPHKAFYIVEPYPGYAGIPYPEDWNIPADPWKKEWWFKE
jgi:hypothetical protein